MTVIARQGRLGHPITVNGIEYSSLKNFAEETGMSYNRICQYVQGNALPPDSLGIDTIIDTKTGITIYNRDDHWKYLVVFEDGSGQPYRSLKAVGVDLGISGNTPYNWVRTGNIHPKFKIKELRRLK